MPRTVEEQAELDRRLMNAVERSNPKGIAAALQAGANWDTDIMGASPLERLITKFKERINWPKTSETYKKLGKVATASLYALPLTVLIAALKFPATASFISMGILVASTMTSGMMELYNNMRAHKVANCMLAFQGRDAASALGDLLSRSPELIYSFLEHVCKQKTTHPEHLRLVDKLLREDPHLVSYRGENEYTLLHLAVEQNNSELTRLLLVRGASPDAEATYSDGDGGTILKTPMDLARWNRECELILKKSREQLIREWRERDVAELPIERRIPPPPGRGPAPFPPGGRRLGGEDRELIPSLRRGLETGVGKNIGGGSICLGR